MDTQSEYLSDTDSHLELQLGGAKTDEDADADTGTLETKDELETTELTDESDQDESDSDSDDEEPQSQTLRANGIMGQSLSIKEPRFRNCKPNEYATKYEVTAALAKRAKLLEGGAEPMVPYDDLIEVTDIAKRELRMRKIPIIIERPFPDGTIIRVKLSDLIIPPGFF